MKWEEIKIGEIALGIFDGPHATPAEAQSGPIFLGIKNISEDCRLDFSEIRHISNEEYPKWIKRIKPKPGDIIFSYEATLHRYAIIPEGFEGCLGRRMALVRPKVNKVDNKFLYYYFRSENWFKEVSRHIIVGSTVDRIPLSLFPNFKIQLPPLPTQQKIAAILSAYDDLIENNMRRIKLLEEAAQQLYREWFVRFRFPGWEDAKFGEDGLPEGWERNVKLNSVFLIKYGSNLSTNEIANKGKFPVYGASGQIGYYSLCNLNSKAVLITSRGNGSGDVHRTHEIESFVTNNSFMVTPKQGFEQIHLAFTIQILKNINLKSYCSGSAQPQLTNSALANIEIHLPDRDLIESYSEKCNDFFQMVDSLLQQNQLLKTARDLLLPRLMNNMVHV